MQDSRFDTALKDFNLWLKDNNIDFKNIISTEGFSNTEAKLGNNSISKLPIKEYDQAIDIAKRLEVSTSVGKDFADLLQKNDVNQARGNEELLDLSRSFKNIVEEGPKSAVEQKLMDTVDTFLSPQEKKQAVDQNLNVGDVVKQVNQSIQRSSEMALESLQKTKEREQDNRKEVEEKQKQPEKKMTSLGEEFGVLDAIVKSMREVLEASKEKSLEQEPPKRKFSIESVKSDDIGNTLKNMGKDPNHVQNQGQGMSR